jgi:polygalacturonase
VLLSPTTPASEAADSFFNPPARPTRCDSYVADFGARGDGRTDDTDAFNNAVWYLPSGGTLCVPSGVYLVNALKSVHLKASMTLWMAPDAVLRAIPNDQQQYAIVRIWKQSGVVMYGGVIEGERKQHRGTTGEWGMGIDVRGSSRITIRQVQVRDCWGDGILIAGFDDRTYIDPATDSPYSENVDIVDVVADGNRRQGVSLISGRNVAFIRPWLGNTAGTPPAAGIDIEPDLPTQSVANVHVIDAVTRNNQGPGIMLLLNKLQQDSYVSVAIAGHADRGSSRGLYLVAPDQRGSIVVRGHDWSASKRELEIQRSCEMELTLIGGGSRARPPSCR